MPFRMSSDQTATREQGEGPGPSTGGIAKFTNADQASEGPGVKPGGIAGSAVAGKGIKRKLDAKSYETKFDAIMTVELGGKSKKQIASDFGIPMSTLSTWLKNKEEIKNKYLSGEMGSRRKKFRTSKFPEVEDALIKWFKNARDQNISVSGDLIREKARFFASRLGISDSVFECSSGWLERFKTRHNITFKKVCGESKSVDENSDQINEWKKKLGNILKDYSPDQIYNADETGLFFRLMPDKTFEFKDKKCHGGKLSKDRLTALVCSNTSGNDKLPILIIGKSLNPRCFKNVKSLPTEYQANKKAWMTSAIFSDWLHSLDKKMTKRKRSIIMIVDNCPAHPNVQGLKSIKLAFLPPNTTSITQPMDQGVIRNLKLHYRKFILQKKIRSVDTKTEFSITVLDALRMLNNAWGKVTPTTIYNCYKHAGFQSIDVPDNSDEEDIDDDIPLAQLCKTGLSFTVNVDDYTTVDDNVLTSATRSDEDIIQDIFASRNSSESVHSDEEQEPVPIKPSTTSVLSAIDVISAHLEYLHNSNSAVQKFNDVSNFIMKEHLVNVYTKQSDISSFFNTKCTSSQD